MSIVFGNPAISYNQINGGLKYVRALDVDGNSWDTPILVDPTNSGGEYTSLHIVNNHPAISYYDYHISYSSLKYIRSADMFGIVWEPPKVLDANDYVGKNTSLAVINGFPAISYYENKLTSGALKYVRATDNEGTGWNSPIELAPYEATYDGGPTSLSEVNGKPAICYSDDSNLRFISALDKVGDVWEGSIMLDANGDNSFMTIINGSPAIAYNGTADHLHYTNFYTANLSHNALDFDGTDDLAETASVYTTQTDNITMEGWVNWNGASEGNWGLLFYNGESHLDGYGLFVYDANPGEITIIIGSIAGYSTGIYLTPGEWTHLALVRDAGVWRLYKNSLEQDINLNVSPNLPTASFKMGGRPGGDYFSGALGQVRLWNTVRTELEISATMNAIPDPNTPGLMASYEMHQDNCGPFLREEKGIMNATLYGTEGTNVFPQFFRADELVGTSWEHEKETNNINVYPNPTSQNIFITYDGVIPVTSIILYDLLGNQVHQFDPTKTEFGLDGIPVGVYFLKLVAGNQQFTKRIIVQR